MAKIRTRQEKIAARKALEERKAMGFKTPGRPPGSFRYVDCASVRIANHVYAAAKRIAIAERRSVTDVVSTLLAEAIARKIGQDPAKMPGREL